MDDYNIHRTDQASSSVAKILVSCFSAPSIAYFSVLEKSKQTRKSLKSKVDTLISLVDF